jgi:surface carbohydrate biosynthesis protein
MKKKIIYITIESTKRELDSKIFLALKALKKNYRVVIGQKGYLREFIKDTNPGIMMLKSIGPSNSLHINYIKKKNFKIVSSDEELIIAMDWEDKMKWRMPKENLNKIDLFLAVGETSDFPVFQKNFRSVLEKIHLCGNLRLELLKQKYRKCLDEETKYLEKSFGNFILLSTSFPRINRYRNKTQIDFVFSRIVENNVDPDSHHIKIENDLIIIQRYILLKTLKFLDNFEKNFPNRNLLISPHPNENVDFWINYVKKRKFKKIFVNKDIHSSSQSLINASNILISSNSTTLLEAHFLDKKKINFLGEEPNFSEMKLLKKISKVVRSVNELNNTIKYFDEIDYKNEASDELKEIKNFDKNFDSFESILDRFDKFKDLNSYDSLFNNKYLYLGNKIRMFKYILKVFLSNIFKLNPWIELKHFQKIGKKLKKKHFIQHVQHLNSIENTNNLKIKQLSKEVFLLDTVD